MGWIILLRRGRQKVQSSHVFVSDMWKAALVNARQKGETVTRNRPVMHTTFIVAFFSDLEKDMHGFIRTGEQCFQRFHIPVFWL